VVAPDHGGDPAPAATPADRRDLDPEELRLAVVLNGGVSLAIWMGGVATELDRLHRGEGAYGEVLSLLASEARVDVVSGSSAGGVNGALLAAAVAGRRPLVGLRDLWIDEGSFHLLLRNPTDAHLPSLLRGDEHLYRALIGAFERVLGPEPPPRPLDPIHLWITTSLLDGEQVAIPDGFGELIPDRNHLGLFQFSHDQAGQWEPAGLAARLALAARCSSSYPGAFEPSLCPVGETVGGRPDMARHVRFRGTRWTVDGGALMNKPFAPALRSVYRRPADRQVRRVVAYVAPLPGLVEPGPDRPLSKPPGVLETVVKTVVDLPRNQSVASELATITEHNEQVAALRRTRTRLVLAPGLLEDARRLFPAHRTSRVDASVERILDQIDVGVARAGLPDRVLPPNRVELRRALVRARQLYLPSAFPSDDEPPTATASGPWLWGATTMEHLAMAVLDLVRRGSVLCPPDQAEAATALREARARVHAVREALAVILDWDDGFWPAQAVEAARVTSSPGGFTDAWALGAFAVWLVRAGDRFDGLPAMADELAAVLVDLRRSLTEVARLARTDREDDPAVELAELVDALVPDPQDGDLRPGPARDLAVGATLRTLLAVEVTLSVVLSDAPEYEQGVRLRLISGEAPNGFDHRRRAATKLAGEQLAHFGGFFKRSWRANDWMFGRLDAAWQLAGVVLSPERLQQLGYGPDEALARVRAIAAGEGAPADVATHLGRRLDEDPGWAQDAAAELAYLGDPSLTPRPMLPRCTEAIARRLQLEILVTEVPAVVAACRADVAEGSSPTAAADLLAEWDARIGIGRPERIPADDAVALFRRIRIGDETLAGERGTDHFLRAASTAVAVGAGVLADSSLGRSPVRPLFLVVRGLSRGFRRLVQGVLWWRGRKATP
jgi:patatin-related protein